MISETGTKSYSIDLQQIWLRIELLGKACDTWVQYYDSGLWQVGTKCGKYAVYFEVPTNNLGQKNCENIPSRIDYTFCW